MFEQLVGRWASQAGHLLRDASADTNREASQVARKWCEEMAGAEFISATVDHREEKFQGEMVLRAGANTGMDGYEKLIRHTVGSGDQLPLPQSAGVPVSGEVDPIGFVPDVAAEAGRVIDGDADIAKFIQFYDQRLQDELRLAGADPSLQRRVENDLRPRRFVSI